jgi:hypothetical protein
MPSVPNPMCQNAINVLNELSGFIECQVAFDNPSVDVYYDLVNTMQKLPDLCGGLIDNSEIMEAIVAAGAEDLLERETQRINESSEERTKTDIVDGEDQILSDFVSLVIDRIYSTATIATELHLN